MTSYKKLIERRSKEDEATAYAFQEFIDTFQNTTPVGKTFIKSGVYNSGNSQEFDDNNKRLYNPTPLIKLSSSDTSKKAIECARLLKDNKYDKSKNAIKPKSNLELLKEELRLRHMDRDMRNKAKKSDNDMLPDCIDTTTNLFLTNLSTKLNEQDLMQIFGVYGPLASVKIMWPRADDRARNSNIGFVAFMSRKDSERAYANLGHRDDMRVSWGKPIEIPSQPIYIPPELVKMMLPPPYSGLPFNAQPLKKKFKFPSNENEMNALLENSLVKVTIPLDKKVLMIIHRVIEFVIREGPMFEAMIMHRELNNPSFQFLFDNKSSTHVYYRWKLNSLMNGESHINWSTKPFRMFKGGSIWIPPTIPDYTKGMQDFQPAKPNVETLSDNQQVRLIQILQGLTISRRKIAEGLIFCIKHANAANDIVNIVNEAFTNPETLATKKIARLYLVSDILYNSKLRKDEFKSFVALFERKLSCIFEHLEVTLSKLSQEADKNAFRSRVLKTLRAWEMWRIFTSEFVDRLETQFLGECNEDAVIDQPLDGKILLTRSLNYNPESIKTSKIQENPIIQVESIEEKENKLFANFIQSKWETLDPAEIESQAMSTKKLYDIEMARLENERREKEISLEYEQLREIELKVLKYQDDLECGKKKVKKYKSIEEEVDEYRRRCIERSKRDLRMIDTSPISTDSFSSDDSCEHSKKRRKRKKEHRRLKKCKNDW